ncbi:MAG: prolyl oligopeptidase family serine peptidase, partial [Rhodothermales bacterium]|nr:prolyl oligopeptidase family serine peptidase [Rhodothermales bacterium]
MPVRLFLLSALLLPLLPSAHAQRLTYPDTRRDTTVVEDYHGTAVADPYRWLEDTNSDETRAWVEAQNEVTFAYLGAIDERAAIERRLTALWDYEKVGAPFKEGDHYFFFRNSGLQNQSVLYQQDALDAQPEVVLDPNTLSEDGTVALATLAFSEDGRYLTYGLSEAGSDWRTFRIRDLGTGEDLDDVLRWIKFSGASWTHDGAGFFYSRYPRPQREGDTYEEVNEGQRLYYHRLGTDQAEDRLVYTPADPKLGVGASVTEDGRWAVLSIWDGTAPENELYVLDLDAEGAEPQPFLTGFDAEYRVVGTDGTTFYVLTNHDAPNRRLVAIDLEAPDPSQWETLIPESEAVIEDVDVINDRFVVQALDDVAARLTIHALDGALVKEVELPALGSVGGVTGERDDAELFYSFTSFTYPTTVYRYDFETGESTVFKAPEVDFDPDAYVVEQAFYPSKDGTEIPMFIVYREDLERDGENPTYLYGYGGFDISVTPSFSVSNLVWMEMGGVVAIANLRGGGEYGQAWHEAGMLGNKQTVFDDFIAAAEYLIDEDFTRPEKLAISGRSNGGLLVGAVMTQRPDLFAAALPAVGVMDMLRFHKFT